MIDHTDENALIEFFSLPVRAKRKVRPLTAVWPCGSRWTIETPIRGDDWEAPEYENGEQTRMTVCAATRAELIDELRSLGATVERR